MCRKCNFTEHLRLATLVKFYVRVVRDKNRVKSCESHARNVYDISVRYSAHGSEGMWDKLFIFLPKRECDHV